MRLGSDEGAVGLPGIVKIAIALAVLGVLGYDTAVTIATHLKAESDAQDAAYAASQAWSNANVDNTPQDAGTAYQAAIQYMIGNESAKCTAELQADATQTAPASIPAGCDYLCTGASTQVAVCGKHGTFMIDQDGTVHLVVRRVAKTLVFGHLGFMHSLLTAYEHGDASIDQG